jgi:hypothetical protein
MACNITHGRVEPCKDAMAGLRNIYFINENVDPAFIFKDSGGGLWVVDSAPDEEIEVVNYIANLYKFELKSNENVYDQEIVSSRENGTTFFRQTLTIKLKKQDIATHLAVKTLSYAKPRIVVENNEGQFFLMGMFRGADLTAGSINNGGNMSDFTGYSLTFTAEEVLPAPFLQLGLGSIRLDTNGGPVTFPTLVTS